ncbi:dynamin-related protein 3A-like [Silene latifolia]|uniref:dynamin-related protein 3A-like n=1 Tax=Silene latifolia TaxID=37657 RepID=UPI003D76E4C7
MADDSSTSSPPHAPPPSTATPSLGQSMIPIVNKLQDIAAQLGSNQAFDLPQVAVVGSQSSGKSSVLEALVGRDFLPRGSDICTRRPLVLQLLQTKKGDEEWGEFLHLPGTRFFDFNDIRREIQAETDREAGANKGVVDKQIRLKIFSPSVLDITLVDLPGITKVPVGDQPSDIEARIRTMIMSYIKIPSCLILAVTPANADLANSDALQMAGMADPDGYRTIGVITKLDIMDRGTDARNFLLGKVIPLRLGYIGVVNRSQEDILLNRSIKDALVAEEKFFQSRPVYSDIADRCGVPQLAKKLNQILVQHIKAVLPNLKAQISAQLVSVAKEHASYGETVESKAGQGSVILTVLSKYSEAFASMVEGKNEEMSTSELSGGARIHYIFQSIFVKSLEEVDPCEDLSDNDIRTAIQNATGPKSALFVPEVPFEVLVRRQIARLLDPSLQCARFIYDELIKMSHRCLANELQRFPILRKRMDDVINSFLREGLQPAEEMIGHIIEMEMDYINTSHHNFVGGAKAVEIAAQQIRSSKSPVSIPKLKDGVDLDKGSASERAIKSRAILPRPANGVIMEQSVRPAADGDKATHPGGANNSTWVSSLFGVADNRTAPKESPMSKSFNEPLHTLEHSISMIHLKEPPTILRPTESHSETEAIEIAVTKLLLKSYFDIVRKNVEDAIPKAIMHFLVNHTKRELHNVFIKKLYRENLFEEMLREPGEVALKRKQTREKLRVLNQAFRVLDELPLDADTVEKGYSLGTDAIGLPKSRLSTSGYSGNLSDDSYSGSPRSHRSRKSSHSGELQSPGYANVDSNGHGSAPGFYPTVHI